MGIALIPEVPRLPLRERDTLPPNKRCVLSSRMPESEAESSHQGQDSSLVSQPSRASFEGQLERFVVLLHGFTRVYQRCEHGCVETLRLATHISTVMCCVVVAVQCRRFKFVVVFCSRYFPAIVVEPDKVTKYEVRNDLFL